MPWLSPLHCFSGAGFGEAWDWFWPFPSPRRCASSVIILNLGNQSDAGSAPENGNGGPVTGDLRRLANSPRLATWIAVCLLGLLGAPAAQAWGCKGHQTVAAIAEKHLTSEAQQMVQKLLGESPIDPKLRRWCGNSTSDLMVDASTWPDDVRNERKNGPWHYIDIPRGKHKGELNEYCGTEGCVTRAIEEQRAVLKDSALLFDGARHTSFRAAVLVQLTLVLPSRNIDVMPGTVLALVADVIGPGRGIHHQVCRRIAAPASQFRIDGVLAKKFQDHLPSFRRQVLLCNRRYGLMTLAPPGLGSRRSKQARKHANHNPRDKA